MSQIVNALQQCIYYFDSCDSVREETLEIIHSLEHQQIGTAELLSTMFTCSIILYLTTWLMFSPVCCYRLSSHGQLARLSLPEIIPRVCGLTVKNVPRIWVLYCSWKIHMKKQNTQTYTQYWLIALSSAVYTSHSYQTFKPPTAVKFS